MASTTDFNVDELQNMKRKQLQSLCKKHGIKANGKNDELVEQLLEATNTDEGEERNSSIGDKDENAGSDELEPSDGEDDTKVDSNNSPAMQAQETGSRVDRPQFSSVAEQVIAEMETRALSLAEGQRKEAVEKYNTLHNIVAETPRKAQLAEKTTAVFDKAHDKIFEDDDSIVNHWSARKTPGKATPNNKRPNADEGAPDTIKRPRVEVLFASPTVVKAKGQKQGSAQAKAMTSKVQRTQTPMTAAASIDGSKTAVSGSRSKPAGLSKLSATTLFATEIAEAKETAKDPAPVASEAARDETAESIKVQDVEAPTMATDPLPETNSSGKCDCTEESVVDEAKIAIPAASEVKPLEEKKVPAAPSSKLPAKHISPVVASATLTAPSNKDKKGVAKQDPAQIPPVKAANYRKVESKLRAYINSKPSEPKVKAIKQSKPEPPKSAMAKQALPSAPPVRSKSHIAKQTKDSGNERSSVPNYMKSTRAAENRANKADTNTQSKEQQQPLGKNSVPGNNPNANPNARFKPYNRPSKPAVAK